MIETRTAPIGMFYSNSDVDTSLNTALVLTSSLVAKLLFNTFSRFSPVSQDDHDAIRFNDLSGQFEATIESLGNRPYATKKPIPVIIEHTGDHEFIATFPETGIAISGDSATEAVQLMKAEMVELYELYKAEPVLGPEPRRRLKVLERYIGKAR